MHKVHQLGTCPEPFKAGHSDALYTPPAIYWSHFCDVTEELSQCPWQTQNALSTDSNFATVVLSFWHDSSLYHSFLYFSLHLSCLSKRPSPVPSLKFGGCPVISRVPRMQSTNYGLYVSLLWGWYPYEGGFAGWGGFCGVGVGGNELLSGAKFSLENNIRGDYI